jgi:hypothetical protein
MNAMAAAEVWSTGSPLISDNQHAIIMQSACNPHAISMQSAHLVDGQPTERECEEVKPAVHE